MDVYQNMLLGDQLISQNLYSVIHQCRCHTCLPSTAGLSEVTPFFSPSLNLWLFSHSQAVTASLNNSSSVLWQYILFHKQWTNVREDTHAIASPYLIYQNDQIQKKTRGTHRLYTENKLKPTKLKMLEWSPFIHLHWLYLLKPRATSYINIEGHHRSLWLYTLFQSSAASVM